MARALLTLSREDRQICELQYYGGYSAARLARKVGIDPPAMRKRLQRIRNKLRKEIEMDEHRSLGSQTFPGDLPASIMDLLARPRLVDLPENPVGAILAVLMSAFSQFENIELPEEIDLRAAEKQLGGDAVYIEPSKLQRVGGDRVLRYDLSLPLLLRVRREKKPQRVASAGKVYRRDEESTTHLEPFHQLEILAVDDAKSLDVGSFARRILSAVDRVSLRWPKGG